MNTPPLPAIDDHDLLLEVFTHKDLRPPSLGDSMWGDGERLADLGARALNAVVTYHFFEQRPCLSAEDIAHKREEYTSPVNLSLWLDCYDLKRRLRVPPNQTELIHSNLEEMETYFHTYVGAICATKGLLPIQNWISKLIDPNSNPELFPALGPQQRSGQDGMGSRNSFTQNQINPIPPSFASANYLAQSPNYHTPSPNYHAPTSNYHAPSPNYPVPLPPAGSPPPLPPLTGSTMPLTGSINLIPLSLVNQTAMQKGYSINYPASQEGPSHQPLWTVKCLINEVERGVGRGKTQKIAKEEAARRAWLAMGWFNG